MNIDSDFKININSLKEFSRVMVPEALTQNIKIRSEFKNSIYTLDIQIGDKNQIFSYRDLKNLIDDQKLTMTKISLLKFYKKNYSWGALMGVRPTKVARKFKDLGASIGEIRDTLENFYLVKKNKIDTLIDVIKKEESFLNRNYMNMYIGIPFCPTKCTYCSFASYEINSGVGRYYKEFVETLLSEIKIVGDYTDTYKQKIESLYIGGGTPSILMEEDLERVLNYINQYINKSHLKEYTFEAGREDTLNANKLNILKKYGVDRISLNPQTFNEKTLKNLNRNFKRDHFNEMYNEAKKMGFILNMDLIIGLPGESTEDIFYTLKEIENFEIENLTIHSLSLKRSSNLFKKDFIRETIDQELIENRIEELINLFEMEPYYLYRQKNIMEWGENIGYSKKGFESIFNIEMIEENQNTFALGGGGITKIIETIEKGTDNIKRIINPKDPALYIKEMLERSKQKFIEFDKLVV